MPSAGQHVERFIEENRQAEEAITANNLSEAAGILVKIVGEDPENARAYNNMGILSWTQESWEDAYVMFLKSIALKPDYIDALVNLFDAALKLKRISDVAPWFEKASLENPSSEEAGVLWETIREQGDEIYQSKRALSVGIYNPQIEEAKKELNSGNLYKAMELFLKINDENGPNAAAFCGLGIISFHQERYNDAIVLFTESIKLNPVDADTYLNLLDAATACNRRDEAVTIFENYRKELPELSQLNSYFKNN